MSFSYKKYGSGDESWGHASDVSRLLARTSYDSELEEDSNRLPYFEACLFVATLEDTLTQLKILVECNPEMSKCRVMSAMTSLLANKYGVEEEAVKDELEGIDPKKLDCLEYSLRKLQQDRNLVQQTLNETYSYLSMERRFEPLTLRVDDIESKYKRLNDLSEDESKYKISIREAYRHLRQHRNHMKSVNYDTNTEIERLKAYLEDAEIISESRSRYVSHWQRSRVDQQLQLISNKEMTPIENIEHFKMKFDQEQRVHAEVELLINIMINENLEKVQEWMDKFDKDMDSLDLKIQLKKNEYNNAYDKRVELENTIKKHADLIVKWKAFKEEREKIRIYREQMNDAAIMVQAWWRGLLVRRQLGPYKVGKKKGKKR